MTACSICLHPQRHAIETALREKVPVKLIAMTYGVPQHIALIAHRRFHMDVAAVTYMPTFPDELKPVGVPITLVDTPTEDIFSPETPLSVLKQGLPYVRQAVKLAGQDIHEYKRIVDTLNDALQSENMGLP